jgi:hypothetical protein
VTLREVQETVAEAAKHTMVSTEALAKSYLDLINTTGNSDFSKAAMQAASQEATRTGKSFESLSGLAGDVQKKFGITADSIGETLRMITANTDIGGPKLEELANGFDLIGAVSEAGGLKGEAGLSLMLGMLNKTAPVLGRFSESGRAMQGVFSALQAPEVFNKIKAMTAGSDSGFVKKLINAPDALSRLDMILKKGGAVRKEFEKGITDRKEIALYKILTEPFDKSVAQAMASGKKGAEAMESGSAAFKASLQGLTRAGDSKVEADKELAARMATSKAKLDQAMKEIEEAFAQPEVIGAVKELMGQVPKLVHIFATLIEFFGKHPMLAPAAVVGGVAAKSVVGSVGGALLGAGAKSAWGWVKGLVGAGTKTAAETAAAAEGTAAAGTAAAGTAAAEGTAVATTAAAGTAEAATVAAGGAAATGGGLLATTAATVTAAGAAAVAAVGVAAVASVGAAVYEGHELFKAAKPEGGTFKAIAEAFSRGGELGGHAGTPADWDAQQAKLRVAQDKQTEKALKAAEVHNVLTRNTERAAAALERLGRAAGGAGSSGNTGDGVSKGPVAPSGGGSGWYTPENMSR